MNEQNERYEPDWDAYHQRCQTGPCFVCQIVARHPDFPAHIVYEDDVTIAFLDKYPVTYGHVIVAPRDHREQATGDFTLDEYLALQRRVYGVTEAVRQEVGAERMYLLSLGSNQGNAHVHFLIVPLPPGVPYDEQQGALFRKGVLVLSEEERASLARRLRNRVLHMET
jgi:diadenosine tetraphosphate (Ap4A) HIT family hydrolase